MTFSTMDRGVIHYLAYPEGPEAAPFREFLLGMAKGIEESEVEFAPELGSLDHPAEILVFKDVAPERVIARQLNPRPPLRRPARL